MSFVPEHAKRVRAHVLIAGRVQGVGYRASTHDQARQRNVTGWVRNRADGQVEAVFEGTAIAVQQLLDWCWGGPPGARVETVVVTWEPTQQEESFQILHTVDRHPL